MRLLRPKHADTRCMRSARPLAHQPTAAACAPPTPQITLAGVGGLGSLGSRDPKVIALHQQLVDVDRKLATGNLDIPPGAWG